jgi:Ca-activated chloride channel family protein
VTVGGHTAEVTLASRQAALDRDFVLSIEAEGLDTPQAWLEQDERGSQAIGVAFVPRLDHGAVPCDVTFLVDRSGSMQGTSIEEVRNALQLCLRSMIPGCCFNIVGFGSRFESLFPEGRTYDDTSLSAASAHVDGLDANLGGTEMLPALGFVLEQRGSQRMPRQVVVLTDGQVTNTDEVLALARKHAHRARIFTFGIGAGASHHLVSGLARAGGGTAEFIYPGERIEPKVVRHFGRLLSPALTNVRMTWGGLDVTQTPSGVPPVFAGGRLLLYALVKQVTATTVTLSAVGPSGHVTFELPVDPLAVSPGRTVGTLAARARIRELEESPAWTSARGSRQHGRKQAGVTQEIVALSLQYGLMSRETSLVAIERRDTPTTGDVQLRRVPVVLTTGWGGLEPSAMPRSLRAASFDQGSFVGEALASLQAVASLSLAAPSTPSRLSRLFQVWGSAGAIADAGASYTAGVTPTSSLHKIVALQRANGSWELTPELAEAIGFDLSRLEAALPDTDDKPAHARRAWATALALAWLRAHAADAEDQWRLLAVKAQAWLKAVGSVPSDGQAWTDAAATFLRDG